MTPVLLDTCALLWIAEDRRLEPAAEAALNELRPPERFTFVSPISAWEVGLLAARGRLNLAMPAERWWAAVMGRGRLGLTPLGAEILMASSSLPGAPPSDPADRIIIATARDHGMRIMTRDRLILDYAQAGHVQAIAC